MSMSATSRSEMNKLRELTHFLLCGAGASRRDVIGRILCYFCRKPLDDYTEFVEHGNAKGPKLDAELSVHHVNGDHNDNALSNKALSHRSCHKGHHRRLANEERALKRAVGAE